MLNELQIKKLLKKSLEQFIDSLKSRSLYFAQYEAECKAYMKVLNDKEMLNRYEFLNIDNSKVLLKELEEYIEENDRVSRAINNIFKEAGYGEVRVITDTGILVRDIHDKYKLHDYLYTVDEDKDIIYIRDYDDKLIFEKFIQSYQKPFSFTIDKKIQEEI